MPSLPPLSSTTPVGLQASAYTTAPGSLKACRRSPLCTSQTKSSSLLLPPPPLASHVPTGLQATLMTMPRCPCSEARSPPWEASHRKTLPSSQQLARHVPSGLHSTRRTLVASPPLTQPQPPVGTPHTRTPTL